MPTVTRKKKKRVVDSNGQAPVKKKKKAKYRQTNFLDTPRKKVKKKSKQLDQKLKAAKEKKATGVSPESRIQSATRGFKLGWGSLPHSKKLSEQQSSKMMQDVRAKADMIKRSKALFDKNPFITAANRAKAKVMARFNSATFPFPEKGVRLFMLETKDIDYKNLSIDEIDKLHAAQIDIFTEEIRGLMAEYQEAVLELQENWPGVLADAKEALQEFYDEKDYPLAEEVPKRLYANLRPYNTELPREYGFVSPAERQQALQAYESQFKEAVRLQEEFVTELMRDAIDQMIESVTNFGEGKQKRFTNSVVENVFNAFEEFKTKTVRYGILEGTAIEAEFKRAIDFMREGSTDAKTLPGLLRQSGAKQENLIEKMGMVRDSLVNQMEKRNRRRLLTD